MDRLDVMKKLCKKFVLAIMYWKKSRRSELAAGR